MGCTPIPADQLFDVILGEAAEIVRKDYEGRIEALEAENERLREALEQFLVLIKHQYFGSREAMNDLQEADNAARTALGEKQ